MTKEIKCSLCPRVGKTFYQSEVSDANGSKTVHLCGKCINEIVTPLFQHETETVMSPTVLKDIIKKDRAVQSAIQKQVLERYDLESETVKLEKESMSPRKIKERLIESIIGQDEAVKAVALAINRSFMSRQDNQIEKTNVMLAGPTGVGKTQITRIVSQILKCPMIIVDCTTLTSSGYIGESVDSIFARLYKKAKNDISQVQNSIVVLDEFDKIVRTYDSGSESVVSVQNDLLQVIADGEYFFSPSKNEPVLRISTKNILFIACGAFSKIRAEKAKKVKSTINLQSSTKSESKKASHQSVTLEDIEKYGVKSELIGRFTHFCDLNPLGVNDLVKILTEKKGCMDEEYKKIFSQNGNVFAPNKEFYESVATEAIELGLGARGLRQVMESRLKDYIFNGEDFIMDDSTQIDKKCA